MSDSVAAALEKASGAAFVLLAITLAGPIAPMGVATALCALLTLARLCLPPRTTWPRTPVDLAMLGWIAATALSIAFAQGHASSWWSLKKAAFPLLVGLAAFHGTDRRTGARALAAYLAATGLVAAAGTLMWVQRGASFVSRARGFSGHYMTFAGSLALALPVAFAIVLLARDRRWRVGAAAVAVFGLAALAVTFTRSAWLAVFASCGVLLAAVSPWGLAALAALGGLAWAFAPGAWGARLHSMFDPASVWNRERVYMWDAGVRMFRDHPWTGVGLQDLHEWYDKYRAPGSTERAGHLHNAYVQIAATMGAAGLAAFAWLYGSLLRATVHGGVRPWRARGLAGGLRLGVLAALVGFLVAGCFEWNFGDEELLYPLYTLVGLAWAAHGWSEEPR